VNKKKSVAAGEKKGHPFMYFRFRCIYGSRNESAGSRDSSVRIATLYGLGGPLFPARWGRNLAYPSTLAPWITDAPVQQAPVLFSAGKLAGALTIHPI